MDYYGGTVDILRRGLKGRFEVQHVRVIYEGGALLPKRPKALENAVDAVELRVKGVEVLVQ
jgi:hypothetical protein